MSDSGDGEEQDAYQAAVELANHLGKGAKEGRQSDDQEGDDDDPLGKGLTLRVRPQNPPKGDD